MRTVNDILAFLDTIAPRAYKMDWDNVGLLCGSRRKEVRKILVALDPFEGVTQEAAEIGADLIVTHHPIIFMPIKNVTDETSIGRSLQILIQNSISAINAHTNLDCAPGGVNDVLAETLGLQNIQVIHPQGADEQGRAWGLLRMGTVDSQPIEQFLSAVKTKLGCEGLRYVSSGKPVRTVAVGGGACADEMFDAIEAGCDTFVTSDVKYNPFWDAYDAGLNLIDAGHFYTENPVCAVLQRKLQAAFPDVDVVISQTHRDCVKFF